MSFAQKSWHRAKQNAWWGLVFPAVLIVAGTISYTLAAPIGQLFIWMLSHLGQAVQIIVPWLPFWPEPFSEQNWGPVNISYYGLFVMLIWLYTRVASEAADADKREWRLLFGACLLVITSGYMVVPLWVPSFPNIFGEASMIVGTAMTILYPLGYAGFVYAENDSDCTFPSKGTLLQMGQQVIAAHLAVGGYVAMASLSYFKPIAPLAGMVGWLSALLVFNYALQVVWGPAKKEEETAALD
ncbi:MAG: hypothetical protein COY40_04735 [Alphaproteobacteria bacterium CG_4_10_14_0_8_um_filter_53_9]|nr:MAG: hypothetical protein COY40_04735 [Alphaproteobacteria bacterium CG_4_10_14_0_8_um_filter_53_9]